MRENVRDKTHAKEIALAKERCFLCAVVTPERLIPGENPLEEIGRLVDTAGGEIAGEIFQRLDRPVSSSYLGKGKLQELAEAALAANADTVVVDDDLSPKQLSAIENACSRKVIDRNEVILDIFQANARTSQAKLQVELAQLQYELPRLARKWTHLERLGGGIGTRGPGESQIETDRRLLRGKIGALKRLLAEIEARKEREVGSRDLFAACLVGYTNAGKSSLLNRLTRAGALVEDRLFATLDTLTRRLDCGDGLEILLSDTVGFIRRLPHHLVASFHATLEEAAKSDILIQVVDASDPLAAVQIDSVVGTLGDIGIAELPRVYALNKIDGATPGAVEALVERCSPSPAFPVSAHTGEGVDALVAHLRKRAEQGMRKTRLRFSAGDGRRFALLNEIAVVLGAEYDGSDVIVAVRINPADLERIRRLPGRMKMERGAGKA